MEYSGIIKIKQIDEPLKIINGNELDSAVENMMKCNLQLRVKKQLLPDDENMYFCIQVQHKINNRLTFGNDYSFSCILAFSHQATRDIIFEKLTENAWYEINK